MRSLLIFLLFVVVGCSGNGAPPIEIADIEITEPLPGRSMSAGFMSITNNTGEPVSITHVTSPDYGKVEIHRSSIEDGVAKMRRIDVLDIAPNSTARLERGGLHLMLMRAQGDPDSISLSFYDGEMLVIDVVASVTRRAN